MLSGTPSLGEDLIGTKNSNDRIRKPLGPYILNILMDPTVPQDDDVSDRFLIHWIRELQRSQQHVIVKQAGRLSLAAPCHFSIKIREYLPFNNDILGLKTLSNTLD
jgi:hypothetical protein